MRSYLTACLICLSLPLFAQVQLTPTTVPVPLEPGQSSTFTLVFSNPNNLPVPSQLLRARFDFVYGPFETDFDVTPLSGDCSDWEDGLEGTSYRLVLISLPGVAARTSIQCSYRITRRTTIQRTVDLRFTGSAQSGVLLLRVPLGVLSDLSANAEYLYSVGSGSTLMHRYRVTISNKGAFDTSIYGFGTCFGGSGIFMNFPGGCSSNVAGLGCFAVGGPAALTGPLLPAGEQRSCEVETRASGPVPSLPRLNLISTLLRHTDRAQMLDINPSNDWLEGVPTNSPSVPGLSIFASLGCAMLLFAVAMVNFKRR